MRRTASQDQRLGAHLIRAPSGHGCGSAWGGGSAPGAIGCSTGPPSTGASPARRDGHASAPLARSVARTILARAALTAARRMGHSLFDPLTQGRLRPPFLCGRAGCGGVLRALRRKSGQRCGNTLGGCIAGLTAAAMGLSPTLQRLSAVYARSTKLARAAAAGRGAGPATDEQAAHCRHPASEESFMRTHTASRTVSPSQRLPVPSSMTL